MSVNGADHHYRLEGRASSDKRIVLVHSVGTDLSLWDDFTRDLLETHRILRYDIRGHGGTAVTPGEYTLDMLGNDLLGLASAHGWGRFSVAGVSIGALVACRASLLSPDRIEKLLLCSVAPCMPAPPGGWDARMQAARRDGMEVLAGGMVERMFSAEYRAMRPPKVDALREVFARTSPAGFASCLAVLRDADLVPELHRVNAPVLLVTGERDALLGQETLQPFAQCLQRFSHVRLDSGHYPLLEAPSRFAGASLDFLAR